MKRLVVFLLSFVLGLVAFGAPAQAQPTKVKAGGSLSAYDCGAGIKTIWQDQIRVGFGQYSTVTLKVCYSTIGGNTRIHAVRVFSPGDKVRGLSWLDLHVNNPTDLQYMDWGPQRVDKGNWLPIGLLACRGSCNSLVATFEVGVNNWPDPDIFVAARVP
jgi:hypothetical protein